MNRLLVGILVAAFSLAALGVAQATPVTLGPESTISVDGTSYTLVAQYPGGVMWEEDGSKECVCKMFGFRALQAVGDYLGLNDTFTRSGTGVKTGWNTDGAEELYVETFHWAGGGGQFAYASPITDTSYLTLADAWYKFTIGSTTYRVQSDAYNYRFTHNTNHPGYHADWNFFDYRTHARTHQGGSPEKIYFRDVVRPQVIGNLKGETRFDVNPVPVPEPASAWLLGSSLALLVAARRRIGL